ncbi:hypothetical protein K2173_009563 [Erythroxylum novogranatense]|uniref:Uncharacterized protein n=1 Tax=Erythroxylum novogranatense TaxID=1862640 RepID=A0AAV8U4A5_9ROSI|nr:hypothetical protein K2173_009563 [Erythroxylum novogranatense]
MEIGKGERQVDLVKSFKLAVRSLLTCCSAQDFSDAFSSFSGIEQQRLRRLFIQAFHSVLLMFLCFPFSQFPPNILQVITSLHPLIEEEFESLCLETQVGTALDRVEQLVEEQSLDPLSSEKTNVSVVARDLWTTKENEIRQLQGILERAEEQNCLIRSQIELLKKRMQDIPGSGENIRKLRKTIANYGGCSNGL